MTTLFIILQSFSNPVWTVSQVGQVWVLILFIAGMLIYWLCESFIQAVKEISLLIKRGYNAVKARFKKSAG